MRKIFSFIGMSGTGKSFWSTRLCREAGFSRVSIDFNIEKMLAPLIGIDKFSNQEQVAHWMKGQSDAEFLERQQIYLDLEERCTTEAVVQALDSLSSSPLVIDTTGSVVHLSDSCIKYLKEKTTVIYLASDGRRVEEMIQHYFIEPRPVIWGDFLTRLEGETFQDSCSRCYPALLGERIRRYKELAHAIVPHAIVSKKSAPIDDFFDAIGYEL